MPHTTRRAVVLHGPSSPSAEGMNWRAYLARSPRTGTTEEQSSGLQIAWRLCGRSHAHLIEDDAGGCVEDGSCDHASVIGSSKRGCPCLASSCQTRFRRGSLWRLFYLGLCDQMPSFAREVRPRRGAMSRYQLEWCRPHFACGGGGRAGSPGGGRPDRQFGADQDVT
jgi:hypothetical protein